MLTDAIQGRIIMMRTWINAGIVGFWSIQLMPGHCEKGTGKEIGHPYQEPAQVPLGEKPKV